MYMYKQKLCHNNERDLAHSENSENSPVPSHGRECIAPSDARAKVHVYVKPNYEDHT